MNEPPARDDHPDTEVRRRAQPERAMLLFVIQEVAHFASLYPIAKLLQSTGRYGAVFMFHTVYDARDDDMATCEANGMVPVATWAVRARHVPRFHRLRSLVRRVLLMLSVVIPTRVRRRLGPRVRRLKRNGVSAGTRRHVRLAWRGGRRPLRKPYRMLRLNAYRVFAIPVLFLLYVLRRIVVRILGVKSIRGHIQPRNALATFRRFTRFIGQIRNVCDDHRIGGFVLAEDNVGHATGAFTRVARERGAPVLVFPYTVANAREFAESYFEQLDHQAGEGPNLWAAWLLPRWVHEHRGRRLMRLPAWNAVAQECLRMAPPNPWAYNSGYATAIVVENEILVDYYRRAGLVREPLYAAGALFDDRLAETLHDRTERRAALYHELGLPPDRPMILCAVPPDQIPSRPHCGFSSFEQVVRAMMEPLRDVGEFNVVVKLHPRIKPRNVAFLRKMGFAIAEAETAELVPLCDLYVASVSATIRWAVSCGRPVVNYDVYRYQYDDYDEAAGVVTTEELVDYRRLVAQLTSNPAALAELTRRQVACMERWGRLDGRAGERILALVDEKFGLPPLAIGHAADAPTHDVDDTNSRPGGCDDADGSDRNGADGTPARAGRRATAA